MPRAKGGNAPVDPAVFGDAQSVESLDAFVAGAELELVRLSGDRADVEAPRLSLDTVRCDALHIPGARLARLQGHTTWWEDCDLSNADLAGAGLRHCVMRRTRLTGVSFAEASLRDALVEDCKLDLANLRFAHLERVTFRNCVLADADFSGSTQRAVRYEGCDLRATQFSQARLDRVDLRGSRLEGIGGIGDLRGARIGNEQLLELAPALAAHLGLRVED